jgi:V8-like Glu-specific endopeptidase
MRKKLLCMAAGVMGLCFMNAQNTQVSSLFDSNQTPNTTQTTYKVKSVETRTTENSRLKPLQVADVFDLQLNTREHYKDGRTGLVYREEFQSEGAGFIKLYIENFDLRPGDYMEVYNPNTGDVFIYSEKGKLVGTQQNPYMISEFWTGTLIGDHIILSVFSSNENKDGHYGFDIKKVSYGYSIETMEWLMQRGPDGDNQNRSICSVDNKEAIVCYDGTEMYRKGEAVCRLLINGSGYCTGWLVGCEGNVMTNNHCIGSAGDANNTDFLFNYRYTTCAGSTDATSDVVATSSTFEYTSGGDDFTLVQLPVNPTGTYGYLSLSSAVVNNGERIYIPQHPGGRRKEIAVVTDYMPDGAGFAQVVSNAAARVTYGCDTEGGSSGSPVLRHSDNLVVAIHNTGTGTGSNCTGSFNGAYGRSDEMITQLNAAGLMPACGVDDPNPPSPVINFIGATTSVNEGTDCGFQDIDITVRIAQSATQNADVTFTLTGGTATNLEDFELMTSSITFPAGSSADQTMTIRVYNDAVVETDENITIDLSVNANGGDATQGGLSTATIVIVDDDLAADTAGAPIVLWSDDFESGTTAAWTVSDDTSASATNWAVTNEAGFPDAGFFDSDESNTTQFAYVNDDDCNCDMSGERMMTPAIDLTGLTAASVVFDYVFDNAYAGDIASLQLSTDGGSTWPAAATLASTSAGNEDDLPWVTVTIDLSAYLGQTVNLAAHFNDNAGWGQGFMVDNFRVETPGHANVQTAMNSGSSASFTVHGTGMSYGYDSGSGNVMASIQSNDTHNYGCTEISVSRAGTGGSPYNGSVAPELVADKTIYINASSNSNSADVMVTLYFTEAEIAGWEASTGGAYSRNDLYILRDDTGPITFAPGATINAIETGAATVVTDAANGIVTVQGAFSGLGGFVVGPQSTLLSIADNQLNDSVISLFPNPTNSQITIGLQNDNSLPDAFEVYNMLGQRIMHDNINTVSDLTINTNSLQTGVYFMKIMEGNAAIVLRFVKE